MRRYCSAAVLILLGSVAGCGSAADDSASGPVSGSAAGATSGAADGGASGTGSSGSGGSGSASTGNSGASGTGSTGSGTSGSGSSGGGSTLLLVAAAGQGSPQPTEGFVYSATAGTWSVGTPLGTKTNGAIDSLNGGVAFAFTGANSAVAILTNASDTSGVSGPLQMAAWGSGAWTPFAALGQALKAGAPPSLCAGTTALELGFAADTTNVESNASRTNGTWSATKTLGTFAGGAPSIAARGSDATLAYVRQKDGALVAVDRTAGTWGAEQMVESGTTSTAATATFAPSLVALSGTGPELVLVYTDTSNLDLHFATRTAGKWSAVSDFGLPTKVVNADPVVEGGDSPSPNFATPLLALPNGRAIVAFTSSSQHVYTSQFDGTKWSTATSVFVPWCLDCIDAAQTGLAVGVGSASIELVFGGDATNSGTYTPYHTRFVSGAWTTPKTIAPSMSGFAMFALASQ